MTGNRTKYFKKLTRLDYALICFLSVGLMIAGTSLFRGILGDRRTQVEFLNSSLKSGNGQDNPTVGKLMVDIEGAVISPGVYELTGGSRIKDVLVAAGGYSEKADRVYCEKNINLAQGIKDGQKIYIPYVAYAPSVTGYTEATGAIETINLNSATVEELDTLWGVGAAKAETIVKNRPYVNLEEAVSKGGITKQILEKNVGRITVY